jgi:hypothetical protein
MLRATTMKLPLSLAKIRVQAWAVCHAAPTVRAAAAMSAANAKGLFEVT